MRTSSVKSEVHIDPKPGEIFGGTKPVTTVERIGDQIVVNKSKNEDETKRHEDPQGS